MGSFTELIVGVISSGAATVLARSLQVWLVQRRADVKLNVTGPQGRQVSLDAKRVSDAEHLLNTAWAGLRALPAPPEADQERAMTALPDPDRSRAVLIGTSTYSHLEDLPAVHNNLTGFRDVLIDPALGGLPADKCTIVDEPASDRDVYRALRNDATAAEDTLLVYFAGHGRTGTRNELYLCLPDTNPD